MGGDVLCTPSPPLINKCCLINPLSKCFWKDSLMTKHLSLLPQHHAPPLLPPPPTPPPPPPTNTHTKMWCRARFRGSECKSIRILRAIRLRVFECTRVRLRYDWESRRYKSENLELCGTFGRHKVESSRVDESLVIIRSRVLEVCKRAFGIAQELLEAYDQLRDWVV